MQRREGGGEAMVRGEEVWRQQMERWEGRRADADEDGQGKEAPAAGGDALGQRPNDNQLMRWSGIGASGVIGDQRWMQLARQLTASDKWRHDGREYGFVTRDVKARGMQARKRRKEGMTRGGGDQRCMLHP
jgi:hypothetical protein